MPRRLIAPLAALALVALFPLSGATFYVELTTKIMIMAIFALSLDLLVGWTGLVSFGHAAYFGVGAYALAMLSPKAAAADLWSSLAIAVLAAAVCAFVVGIFVLRTRGIYFIMVTLAFAQMFYFVFHDTERRRRVGRPLRQPEAGREHPRLHAVRPRPAGAHVLRRARRAGARVRVPAAGAAVAVRARAAGHPRQRAADARARLPGDRVQARRVHARRGAGRIRGLPARGAVRLRQPGDPVLAPVGQRAADGDPRRRGHARTARSSARSR